MNVNDARTEETRGDRLVAIFERQRELIATYHDVEVANGSWYARARVADPETGRLDLDDRWAQYLLKDMAWRVVEEIAEAYEAARVHADVPQHAGEEVADALHFLVELCILSGVDESAVDEIASLHLSSPSDYRDGVERWWLATPPRVLSDDPPSCYSWVLVEMVGLAMNCLKMKPWKRTDVPTDAARYRDLILQAILLFPRAAADLGVESPGEMTDLYLRKSQVNKFRLRSNY